MKKPFIKIGFIGIVVIIMSIILMFVFPSRSPSMIEGFLTPIIAFEFIQSPEEVFQLFGPANSPERETMIRTMNRGNYLDFIYMLLYSSFLFAFSITCAKVTGKKFFYTGALISVIVLIGDFLENVQLLEITSKLQTGNFEDNLFYLKIFTWQKWGGIAAIFIVLATYFIRGTVFERILAFFGAFTFLIGVLAFLNRSVINEIFSLCVAVMFLLMIIFCFIKKVPLSAENQGGLIR
jgi:hypothetical protein